MRRSEADTSAFLAARAEEMRWSPTPAEKLLWCVLEPLGFKSQQPMVAEHWPYILDFYHVEARLCIEVDGGSHKRRRGRDRRRDKRLKAIGIRTLRFTNNEVLTKLDSVVSQIKEAMKS